MLSLTPLVVRSLYSIQLRYLTFRSCLLPLDENPIVHGLETLIEYYQDPVNDLGLTEPVLKDPPPHDTRRHGRTNLLHRATKQGSNYNYLPISSFPSSKSEQ